jgi:hypothetical protein
LAHGTRQAKERELERTNGPGLGASSQPSLPRLADPEPRLDPLSLGLDPKLGAGLWSRGEDDYADGICLWRTLAEAEDYAWGLAEPFDIWEILASPAVKVDPLNPQCVHALAPIPAGLLSPVLHVPSLTQLSANVPVPELELPSADCSWYEDAELALLAWADAASALA